MALELFPHLKLIPLQSGLIEIPCSGLIQPYLSNLGVRFYLEILTPGLAFMGLPSQVLLVLRAKIRTFVTGDYCR